MNPTVANASYSVSVSTSQDSVAVGNVLHHPCRRGPPDGHRGRRPDGQVGTPYATAFAPSLTDAFGNVIPGAPVTFTAPASGPSGTFAGSGASENVTRRFRRGDDLACLHRQHHGGDLAVTASRPGG